MKRLLFAFTLVAAGSAASGQSLSTYLQLRKQNAITGAASPEALQSVVGSKVVEIDGVVKGSFRVGDRTTLLFQRSAGGTQEVETDVVPEWMVGTESPARLLVKVIHPDPSAPMRILMLGAAHEEEIRKVEAKSAPKTKSAVAKKSQSSPTFSRNSRSALFGTIGRGGSRLERRAPRGTVSVDQALPIYAAFIKKVNPRLKDREALVMAHALINASRAYSVDARLVVSMVIIESGFNPASVSRTGAMGLGQLMPGTAEWMGVRNPFDTVENLYGMVRLIRTHLNQYNGDLDLTLAAYNAGMGAVRRHGGVPPFRETQAYVQKVKWIFDRLRGGA